VKEQTRPFVPGRKREPKTAAEQKAAPHADTRQFWLRGLLDVREWLEHYVADDVGDRIGWKFQDGPGMFDHGIIKKRIDESIDRLKRIRGELPA
jgi:hypothetical protein